MSNPTPEINLISILLEIAKTKLSSDLYGFLEYNFGLDGAASLEEVRKNIASLDSKAEVKKLRSALNGLMQALHQDEKTSLITGELQSLRADLIGSKNYVDNFNTEEKLIARLNAHYNYESLTAAQIGIALITFYLLEFERIDIVGCQIIWKLTDNDVTPKILQTLHETIIEILNIKPEPIEVSVLRRRIVDKKRSKNMPDEALVRFILSINPSIEVLKEQASVQFKLEELYDYQMPYRILFENKKQMTVRQMEEEITQRLKPFGRKIPQVKNFLSGEWYAKGNDGWGLKEWGIKKDEIPDLLKIWFQETKTPATRVQMTNYLQPLRPNLKSISNMLLTYDEIVKVEYAQSDLNPSGREELYYHKGVALPEGVKAKRTPAKSSSAKTVTAKKSKLPKLFISYSHVNNNWRTEFRKYFDPAQKNQKLEVWDDTKIAAGDRWHDEINTALENADGALFLVTQDFLNSDFITDQELPILIKRAKKGQLKIYWVLVESCLFKESPLAQLQATNMVSEPLYGMKGDRKKAAITDICGRIISELTSS